LAAFQVARRARLAQNAPMAGTETISSAAPYPLAVIMERVRLVDRWGSERWETKGVVRDISPPESAERVIRADEGTTEMLFPGMALRLNPAEAEGYYLNITSPQPKVFVLWRKDGEIARPAYLTVSYNEGTRWADSGENVDGVALPADLLPWIAEYAAEHYRPEPKKKPRYASSKDKGVASRR
jgi:hypothetical protein